MYYFQSSVVKNLCCDYPSSLNFASVTSTPGITQITKSYCLLYFLQNVTQKCRLLKKTQGSISYFYAVISYYPNCFFTDAKNVQERFSAAILAALPPGQPITNGNAKA